MAVLRLFAAAREAAGTALEHFEGNTVGDVLAAARLRYGEGFSTVLGRSRVWLNGQPAALEDTVVDDDEVAVLPPVSGGSQGMAHRATRPALAGRHRLAPAIRFRTAAPVSAPAGGPHIRLGLVWALVTHVAAAAGPVPLAMVITPVAALAALQAARSWRRRQRRAAVPVSGAGAALVAGVSIFGILAVGAAVVLVVCVLIAARLAAPQGTRAASPGLTGVIAVAFGGAGAALVLLRAEAFIPVFVLLSFVQVYDASAYVVGAGAASPWEGPAAGVASIAAVTLAVAAVLSPPFRGATPWLFGLLAAALAPVGPLAAADLIGDRRARVPAVRRLDSLLLLGPVWALAAALSLD